MKIKINNKKLPFGMLNNGDCFEFNKEIYIKTLEIIDSHNLKINCVDLNHGGYKYFDLEIEVGLYSEAVIILE